MTAKVVILGGGFAGLYAAYVTGGTLISEAPVRDTKRHASNYIFLHSDNRVQMLLQELGLLYERHQLKIGYYMGGDTYSHADSEMVRAYIRKAYPNHDEGNAAKVSPFYFKGHLDVCNSNYFALLQRLEDLVHDQIVFDKAEAIHLKHRNLWLDEFSPIEYDVLISTIPLNAFLKLSGLGNLVGTLNLQSSPLFFYESSHDMQGYDIVMDASYPGDILRWTRYEGLTLEERTKSNGFGNCLVRLSQGKVSEAGTANHGKKILLPTLESMGAYMCGRFAEWRPHFDTEDAISRVTEIAVKILGGKA